MNILVVQLLTQSERISLEPQCFLHLPIYVDFRHKKMFIRVHLVQIYT